MSGLQRLALLAAAAAVAVAAFVILEPSDDEGGTRTRDRTERTGTRPVARPRPAPSPARIRVANGRPLGGIRRIEVEQGETVRFQVSSSDISDEVHVHGYDLTRELAPGKPAGFHFEARIEGVFEVELEGANVQIASVTVKPS